VVVRQILDLCVININLDLPASQLDGNYSINEINAVRTPVIDVVFGALLCVLVTLKLLSGRIPVTHRISLRQLHGVRTANVYRMPLMLAVPSWYPFVLTLYLMSVLLFALPSSADFNIT